MSTLMNRRTFTKALTAAVLALGVTTIASAASQLNDIKSRGVVRIGVLSELPPWGFIDADGKNVGYDVDVGKLLAQKMGVKAEFVSMNVAARIPSLMTGKVDLLLATMGMYPDRAKVVQFSKPYAALSIIVLGKKDTKIEKPADLANMRVGVPRASAQDIALTNSVPPSTTLQRFDDDAATVQALVAGQVDAIGGNTTYIMNINKAMPNNTFQEKFTLNRQYMGVAMKPKDKELNAWVNQFIDDIKANGQLNAISQKWIGQDLPDLVTSMPGVPFTVQ
ncbi:Polar amino acid transport system substrate-binding protein OS=Castellaniella defragrans OX=75697 GN=HNR28_002470 PE=4 SV=1 [Castellaniella defragrans]